MSEKKDLKEKENEEPVNEEDVEDVNEREEKAQEYLDGWKRCQADFENYKKRQAKLHADLAQYSNQNLILEIFPVIDNFQASLEHIPEDQKESPWVVGVTHIQKQLENILAQNGVAEIPAKEGDEFNPEIHEAVHQKTGSSERETGKKPDGGEINKVLQKGYKIGDRVLRPVRVVVE